MDGALNQFSLELERFGELHPILPALCFVVGIVAAIWLLRRSFLALVQRGGERDLACLKARSHGAHIEIDQISAREWLGRYKRAQKFSRGSLTRNAKQQRLLERLNLLQGRMEQR